MMTDKVCPFSGIMNPSEGKWARDTISLYLHCKKHNVDTGREYYVYREEERLLTVKDMPSSAPCLLNDKPVCV